MYKSKFALIHEWLVNIAGSEKVAKEIYNIFNADIFTLIKKEEVAKQLFPKTTVKTSLLQGIPRIDKFYHWFLPLFPIAVEQFNLSEYDIIISSSHAVAKGVITSGEQLHICYCHTPIRYAWDLYHHYTHNLGLIKKLMSAIILHYIRIWDALSANRVDYFIANSKFVARRIRRVYRREAKVIYPPVEVEKFSLTENREDYYITVSRLVPYKRVDIIVKAFNLLKDKKLIVVGNGPQLKELKKIAGKNVYFMGNVSFNELKKLLSRAKAFLFAAEEDFGIAPVEAQACGIPVIAYGKGGILETVIEGKTGLFYYEQTPQDIVEAIRKFESLDEKFNPLEIRANAERFSTRRFRKEIKEFVEQKVEEFKLKKGGVSP